MIRILQTNNKPNFLLLKHLENDENRIEITIADAKSSSRMRIEHCIQVALYTMDLRVWIERNQLDQHVFFIYYVLFNYIQLFTNHLLFKCWDILI